MALKEDFECAAAKVKDMKVRPNDSELLELYALFKQAKVGDVNTARPGMLDMKGKAKWDAWETKKGVSQDEAMTKYIEYANSMIAKYAS